MTDLDDFVHLHEPPTPGESRYLLLLHGTGGDERDILSLGRLMAPSLGRLAVRGKVREGGANRYFRRFAEGVFDIPDLEARADELAEWVVRATDHYRIDRSRLTALGFSNGANVASVILLRRPETFRDAVLLRPMFPYRPDRPVDLRGHRVLALAGRNDELIAPDHVERLAALLTERGATVEVQIVPAGHGIARADLTAVTPWLEAGAAPG